MFTLNQWRSFVARCAYGFFLDGTLKSYGVILMDTVTKLNSKHYLVGWAFTLQSGAGYLISPLAGILLTKMSCRSVAMLGGLLAGSAYVIRGLVNISEIWQLFLLVSCSGIGFGLINISTVVPLKESFGTSFATAYAVTGLAANVGIAVLPFLLKYLMGSFGDRTGMLIFGALSWTLIVTGAMLPSNKNGKEEKVKEDYSLANEDDALDDIDEEPEKETNLDEAERIETLTTSDKLTNFEVSDMRRRPYERIENGDNTNCDVKRSKINIENIKILFIRFYGVFQHHPALFLFMIVSSIQDHGYRSWSVFLIPYGEYLGIISEKAVLLSTIGGVAGIIGRLYCILLFSRYAMDVYLGFALPSLLITVSYTISFFCDQFHVLAVVAALTGFSYAVMSSANSGLIPSCVCDDHFKVTVVTLYTLWGIMVQLGGITTGLVVDLTGSYRISFGCLTVLSFLSYVVAFGWTLSPLRLRMKKPGETERL
ncbi:monocarboxylate transporter 7-like [Apostichopus japonicus]|uniref:monocarboxylate transporter 7-like n=1 Tax=Stichopus japonicus TaxID=307972 RepID=UPI003AB803AB